MSKFFEKWGEAAITSLGFFWMAFWAFVLGYIISSLIQVFVSRERMKRTMGDAGAGSVALGAFFGFISSSCSFAALATTKSLFKKGAGLVPALAFLLASTNLVIELGIIISIFLGWQFVVGEYLGGLLLIGFTWIVVKLTLPSWLEKEARENVESEEDDKEIPDWKELIGSLEGWRKVANQYFMEWGMVWKDVAFGFTVAGIISAFVPRAFFEALFIGAGSNSELAFWQIALQTLVGPLAAFFTFIGSMGNIPLAALLFENGVSFAGVMAFIFSDLVVFPVLRINAKYYGWKMALYITGVFLLSLCSAAIVMHYGFEAAGILPESAAGESMKPSERFAIDYTFFLNLGFLFITAGFAWLRWNQKSDEHSHSGSDKSLKEKVFSFIAIGSLLWLAGGAFIYLS